MAGLFNNHDDVEETKQTQENKSTSISSIIERSLKRIKDLEAQIESAKAENEQLRSQQGGVSSEALDRIEAKLSAWDNEKTDLIDQVLNAQQEKVSLNKNLQDKDNQIAQLGQELESLKKSEIDPQELEKLQTAKRSAEERLANLEGSLSDEKAKVADFMMNLGESSEAAQEKLFDKVMDIQNLRNKAQTAAEEAQKKADEILQNARKNETELNQNLASKRSELAELERSLAATNQKNQAALAEVNRIQSQKDAKQKEFDELKAQFEEYAGEMEEYKAQVAELLQALQ